LKEGTVNTFDSRKNHVEQMMDPHPVNLPENGKIPKMERFREVEKIWI
jgi:hypothetical protein